MASRQISDLSPYMQVQCTAHLAACQDAGIDVILTCTYRDNIEQAQLYAKGRTEPGLRLTNAKPGESAHNVLGASGKPAAEAYDLAILRHGKLVWDTTDPAWATVGALGKQLGLEWAGSDWKSFKEYPHFENPRWQPTSKPATTEMAIRSVD